MLKILLFLASVSVIFGQFECPDGYELYGSKCYIEIFNLPFHEFSKPKTFYEAVATCQSLHGSRLPKVVDRLQNGILRSSKNDVWIGLMWKNPGSNDTFNFESLTKGCKSDHCWLDGTDLGDYQPFATKPPESDQGVFCMALSVESGEWYYENCTTKHDIFCETDRIEIPQDTAPICNRRGRYVCECEKGYSGDQCEIDTKNSRTITRCWRFKPNVNAVIGSIDKKEMEKIREGCGKGEFCLPDDLDCLEDKSCKNPIGWCIPKHG